jgi:hypothetical protein
MSDGTESLLPESPQAERVAEPVVLTPPAATSAQKAAAAEEKRGNNQADAERKRRQQELELQRERILSERTSSPHRRSALAAALTDIEEKLTELGWVLHL